MKKSLTQSRSTWLHQKLLSQKLSLNGGVCPPCTSSSNANLTPRALLFFSAPEDLNQPKNSENCCCHWIPVFFSIPLTELLESSATILPPSCTGSVLPNTTDPSTQCWGAPMGWRHPPALLGTYLLEDSLQWWSWPWQLSSSHIPPLEGCRIQTLNLESSVRATSLHLINRVYGNMKDSCCQSAVLISPPGIRGSSCYP